MWSIKPLRYLLLALALVHSLPAGRAVAASEFLCVRSFRFISPNADEPAVTYRQYATRSLKDLDKALFPGFNVGIDKAPFPLAILDVGGGYSLYGVELTAKGHTVITINAQDFYRDAFFPLATEKGFKTWYDELPQRNGERVVLTNDTLGTPLFERLSTTFGVALPDGFVRGGDGFFYFPNTVSAESAQRQIKAFTDKVKEKLSAAEADGKFSRITNYAQAELHKIETGSQNLLIDSFGAFYYSRDRFDSSPMPGLLAEYYRTLKPGGGAVIAVSALSDTVVLPNGASMDLYLFLSTAAPRIFSLHNVDGVRTLMMKRTEDPDIVMRILQQLGEPKVEMHESPEITYPTFEFRLPK